MYAGKSRHVDVGQGPVRKIDFGARIADHERKVIGWDRGCTLGANGQCFGAGLDPFSSVNPTLYPSGFNGNALGIPGLLDARAASTAARAWANASRCSTSA